MSVAALMNLLRKAGPMSCEDIWKSVQPLGIINSKTHTRKLLLFMQKKHWVNAKRNPNQVAGGKTLPFLYKINKNKDPLRKKLNNIESKTTELAPGDAPHRDGWIHPWNRKRLKKQSSEEVELDFDPTIEGHHVEGRGRAKAKNLTTSGNENKKEETILKAGYAKLMKRTGMKITWQRRWCTVSYDTFNMYREESAASGEPMKSISLSDNFSVRVPVEATDDPKTYANAFEIMHGKRKNFVYKCDDKDSFDSWMESFGKALAGEHNKDTVVKGKPEAGNILRKGRELVSKELKEIELEEKKVEKENKMLETFGDAFEDPFSARNAPGDDDEFIDDDDGEFIEDDLLAENNGIGDLEKEIREEREEDKKKKEEEDKKKKEEEDRKKQEAEKKKKEEEDKKKKEEENRKKQEAEKKKKEEEDKNKQEAEKKKKEEEDKKKKEEEDRKKKEAEKKKKEEEDKNKQEAEKKKKEEGDKNKQEAEKKKKEEEDKKKKEEEDRKKKEEQDKKKEEEEAKKKQEESKKLEAEKKRKEEEERKKLEEEEERRKKLEEEKKKADVKIGTVNSPRLSALLSQFEQKNTAPSLEETKKRAEERKKKLEEEKRAEKEKQEKAKADQSREAQEKQRAEAEQKEKEKLEHERKEKEEKEKLENERKEKEKLENERKEKEREEQEKKEKENTKKEDELNVDTPRSRGNSRVQALKAMFEKK